MPTKKPTKTEKPKKGTSTIDVYPESPVLTPPEPAAPPAPEPEPIAPPEPPTPRICVRAKAKGYYDGLKFDGDEFTIATMEEFSPEWMEVV